MHGAIPPLAIHFNGTVLIYAAQICLYILAYFQCKLKNTKVVFMKLTMVRFITNFKSALLLFCETM
jgi:hypothetical protein